MNEPAYEVNFDGLVGPTHNYAALAEGNIASQQHGGEVSNPKAAALQGIKKMKLLMDLGVRQAVLPPHDRPDIAALRRLGFSGNDAAVLQRAAHEAPRLLAACGSASAMWAANAATVSPAEDTADRRVHITPANLCSHLHRTLETPTTTGVLRTIFADRAFFEVYDPLPASAHLQDEGAANHTRLCLTYGSLGLELFTYGEATQIYPARQRRAASEAVARLHGLDPQRTIFIQQNPRAIDAGVFHNDVIAVGNENVLVLHTEAWADQHAAIDEVRRRFEHACGGALEVITVASAELSVEDAVATYLFNSQLITLPDESMALICPSECQSHAGANAALDRITSADNPIRDVHFVDTRQSMRNGGGPACLRLRIVLTDHEIHRMRGRVMLDEPLYADLTAWVERHYRDELRGEDLADPALLNESRAALDELTQLLKLGSIYAFQ